MRIPSFELTELSCLILMVSASSITSTIAVKEFIAFRVMVTKIIAAICLA